MAQVHPIGEPANDCERQAIAALRDRLPADYRVLHNFELRGDGGQWFEIDVAVVAPHAVYLVDVKGTAGEIHVAGSQWHPEGRAPFASPLAKLRHHTRLLHGLLVAAASGPHAALRHVWVEAAVLFCRPDSSLRDPEGRDGPHVCALRDIPRFFTDASRLPQRTPPPGSTAPHLGHILSTLTGKARAANRLPLFGGAWQCEERLTANDSYIEYRARDAHVPGTAPVTVRVYPADPYLPAAEREVRKERIANAYTALKRLPAHPAIPPALGFFPTEGGDGWVLVLGEVPGSSLRLHLDKPALRPTADEKAALTRGLLTALAHCHAHGVLHRAVSPATVVVGPGGAARLVDFDFARPGPPRDRTLPSTDFEVLDQSCVAPEAFADVHTGATPAADVYAAGATFYELWTNRRAFRDPDDADARGCLFPEKPSALVPGLPAGFDDWLQRLCAQDVAMRPSAAEALAEFDALFAPAPSEPAPTEPAASVEPPVDYGNLPSGHLLKSRYLVEGTLGKKGGFGRVYRVIDTLGDITRALKIVTSDSSSTLERMKQEYRVVTNLPEHPGVVRIHFADLIDGGGPPFLLMEYVEGASVAELIRDRKLSTAETHRLGIQAAEALAHCHANAVVHGDIKPENLMWTERGAVKLIDFNVAVKEGDLWARGGGTKRYLPPDLDLSHPLTHEEKIERDGYALGITLYEAVTGGEYPWANADRPPRDQPARDPRGLPGCNDLAPTFVEVLRRAIAPRRAERYGSVAAFAVALRGVGELRVPPVVRTTPGAITQGLETLTAPPHRPNINPFVFYLQTLYSQARRTNAGTRGLDTMGRAIYVETALDRALRPATLGGEFRLVLISGNAGDGKTAFIQQLERDVRGRGVSVAAYGTGNGTAWEENGHRFRTNYDGSQDEGDKINDDVLREFFAPFAGVDAATWSADETRVIAINEGRLIDFLEQFGAEFPRLKTIVHRGLRTGAPEDNVAVVNLNLRNVTAETNELPSIFSRLLRRLVEPQFWAACESCDLRDKCYVHHNARTFANPAAGAQVVERLGLLYRLTTLRGKLHITLRDLRSALAFTIAGIRDCDEIHALHARGDRDEWVRGFYFNSWKGHETDEGDRLLRLLGEVDVGESSDPKLDRAFDFHPPDPAPELMDFEGRGRYDRDLLTTIYAGLPLEVTTLHLGARFSRHREYVATLRRRHFFEARDESWRKLIPYGAASAMLRVLAERPEPHAAALDVIRAINRGEGIFDTRRMRGKLALQVRHVESATVRSYRVFSAADFTLVPQEPAQASPYLEHAPTALRLLYRNGEEGGAELLITLDVWEMLERLNQGYRPTPDEAQGYGLALAVFKNILGSAPYQEVLLTPSGHDFYAVSRAPGGELTMRVAEEPTEYGAR